jgi:hypothetical protein
VKYEFPRFFGITKTLRPVLRPPVAAALDEPPAGALALVLAAADEDDAAGAEELGAVEVVDELELQADSATVAATGSARASHVARLRCISLYPFNSVLQSFQ